MKSYLHIFVAIIFLSSNNAWSADSLSTKPDTVKHWTTGGFATLAFNQIGISNWAKGGENSISGSSFFNVFENYQDEIIFWENSLDLGFGLVQSDEFGLRKTEDKIDLNSKFGHKAFDNFFYTGLMNFKTQFANGYNYPNDSVIVSKLFAPAYLVVSIGMDFKPSSIFSIYLSPATGRFIWVTDQDLADLGAFSVDPAIRDTAGKIITHGKTFRPDFGAYLTTKFQMEVLEGVNVQSKLDLFNNYTDKIASNRKNIAVNWENTILLKVNKFISANINVIMIYDHNIKVPLYEKINGVKTKVGDGPRLQIKEVFGIGFSYKL